MQNEHLLKINIDHLQSRVTELEASKASLKQKIKELVQVTNFDFISLKIILLKISFNL